MKTVLITGATSGIGKQLAMDYARDHWQVIACGRNEQALAELAQQFETITPLRFDVTDLAQTTQAIDSIEKTPDIWLLSAGDCEYIDDGVMDAALFERIFAINVMGVVNLVTAAQSRFSPGQRVAILGSIASEVALPRAEAYGASKAAVSYLARTLQLDLKPKGVDVTLIFPGFVKTPLTDKNTFDMPMMVSVQSASDSIRRGLEKGVSTLYFPKRFTTLLRVFGALPYRWQTALVSRLLGSR